MLTQTCICTYREGFLELQRETSLLFLFFYFFILFFFFLRKGLANLNTSLKRKFFWSKKLFAVMLIYSCNAGIYLLVGIVESSLIFISRFYCF